MVEQLFSQATSGIVSGIQVDIMAVFTSLINIGLVLLAARIIYGIIKGETIEGHIQGWIQKARDARDEADYQEIYAEEMERFRIENLRSRARDEIRGR